MAKSSAKWELSARRAALVNLGANYANLIFQIITGLVLVPVYLKYIDLEVYGAWLASGNIIGMLGMLDGGINLLLTQRLAAAHGAADFKNFVREFASGSVITFSLLSLIPLCCGLVLPWLAQIINYSGEASVALQQGFLAAAIGAFFSLGYATMGCVVQAWQETAAQAVTGIVMLLVGVVVSLWALFSGAGIASLGYGQAARGIAGFVLLAGYVVWRWHARRLPLPKPDVPHIRSLVRYSLPVFAGRVGGGVLGNCSALIVSNLMSPAATAVFVLTGRVVNMIGGLLNPIGSSIFAGLARQAGAGELARCRVSIEKLLRISACVGAVALGCVMALNRQFMTLWVGPEKFGGVALTGALCLSLFTMVRTNQINLVLAAMGQVQKAAVLSLVELMIRLPALYILIKFFGLIGVPLAEVISSFSIAMSRTVPILGRALSLSRAESKLLFFRSLPVAGLVFGLGVLGSFIIPAELTWLTLSLSGGICLFCLLGVLLAVGSEERADVLIEIRHVGSRFFPRAKF